MKILEKIEYYLESSWVKRLLLSVLIGITTVGYASEYSTDIHNDLASNIIRLHVIANSDSEADQQLKLKVRDGVTEYLSNRLKNAENIESAKELIDQCLEEVSEIAQNTIIENGYVYNVEAVSGVYDFTTKSYYEAKLPAGNYYALKIIIGEGKGKNWWSVIYPELCFKSIDKTVLKAETYAVVTENDSPKLQFKFKLLELFKK